MAWLYILFFLSGFPALIYQIVWERALLTVYGVNVESVTIVVSAFMLGLGIGSYLGGMVSKRPDVPLLAAFGLIELSIGVFGVISLQLFHWVGTRTVQDPLFVTGLLTFALVLLPTMLMGSTLPILVAQLVRISGNVGMSVGTLYFVNTLGSATACLLSARFIMVTFGESGAVWLGAGTNAVIGSLALAAHAFFPMRQPAATLNTKSSEPEFTSTYAQAPLRFRWAALAVAMCGFISLSYEIVWFRSYSFVSGSHARAFALLLAAYLEGIAFGSLLSRPLCRRGPGQQASSQLRAIARFAICANLIGFVVVPVMAFSSRFVVYFVTLPVVTLATCLLGALLPLICHLAIVPDQKAGARLSYLYLSNIAGSVVGTLLVGFILMDYWSIRQISVFLACGGLFLGLLFLLPAAEGALRWSYSGGTAAAALVLAVFSGPLFDRPYERMLYKHDFRPTDRFAHVIESKGGIVTVDRDGTVFGNGIYDGRFNVNPLHDTNLIIRCYALSSFHPSPRNVLMIGLSSGSWAQVVANHPQVEKLTIIEINRSYLRLIAQYPEVASLLHNPKVDIIIDDGRRWLVRNPDRKFDAIVMNSSFHWREHASNLLSSDFLQLVRPHLLPGGVLFYNTTSSGEVQLTGATVYPYALRVVNFIVVSDSPIVVDKERWRQTLVNYRIDGKRVFDLTRAEHRKGLERMLALADTLKRGPVNAEMAMESGVTIRVRYRDKRVVTDDNMGTEWLDIPVTN